MTISSKEVTKIAKLARISIKEEEKKEIADKLGKIIDWMDLLSEVETENVQPLFNVHNMQLRMHKDEVKEVDIVKEILKNAPNPKYNYFAVPKVIE